MTLYLTVIAVVSVRRHRSDSAARPDQDRLHDLRHAGAHPTAEHADRHDGQHLPASHLSLREGVEATGKGNLSFT